MNEADYVVRQILGYLEPRIDLDHVARTRARHRAALDYAEADRAPIVFYLPYEGTAFAPYPYPEAFADPAKMMVNELLVGFTSIYHAVDLRDDAPYCLRPNLGTGLIASMFGAEIRLVENNPPWVIPFDRVDALQNIADNPLPNVRAGLGQRAMEQYAYYDEAVKDFPRCRAALQFTLPDLQGPFSTAEMLWGSGIYLAFYDDPELLRRLLEKIAAQMIALYHTLVGKTRDSLGDGYCHQHATAVKGNLLIRNDSMINLSPQMYRDTVLPFDAQLSRELKSVGVHFCGNGQHQVKHLLQIPELGSIDLGNPEKMDLDALYAQAAPRCVALTRLAVSESEMKGARLKQRFPRGVNFTFSAASVRQAHALLEQYQTAS